MFLAAVTLTMFLTLSVAMQAELSPLIQDSSKAPFMSTVQSSSRGV